MLYTSLEEAKRAAICWARALPFMTRAPYRRLINRSGEFCPVVAYTAGVGKFRGEYVYDRPPHFEALVHNLGAVGPSAFMRQIESEVRRCGVDLRKQPNGFDSFLKLSRDAQTDIKKCKSFKQLGAVVVDYSYWFLDMISPLMQHVVHLRENILGLLKDLRRAQKTSTEDSPAASAAESSKPSGEKSKEKSAAESSNPSGEKSKEKSAAESSNPSGEKSKEKSAAKSSEQSGEKSTEQSAKKSPEKLEGGSLDAGEWLPVLEQLKDEFDDIGIESQTWFKEPMDTTHLSVIPSRFKTVIWGDPHIFRLDKKPITCAKLERLTRPYLIGPLG